MLANASYNKGQAVTASNTVNFDGTSQAAGAQPVEADPCDALVVNGAGALALVFQDGSTATITSSVPGQILPFRVVRVNATGTTATGIVALYAV